MSRGLRHTGMRLRPARWTGVRACSIVNSPRFEMEYDHDQDGRRERYALTLEALERSDGGAVVTRADVTAGRQRADGDRRTATRALAPRAGHRAGPTLRRARARAESTAGVHRQQRGGRASPAQARPHRPGGDRRRSCATSCAEDQRAAQVIRRFARCSIAARRTFSRWTRPSWSTRCSSWLTRS